MFQVDVLTEIRLVCPEGVSFKQFGSICRKHGGRYVSSGAKNRVSGCRIPAGFVWLKREQSMVDSALAELQGMFVTSEKG